MNGSIFLISLDFELFWGVRDHRSLKSYGENILGVRKAIPALLELFREYGIHATWATVGFVFFNRREDLLAACPERLPMYDNPQLSPYSALRHIGADEAADPFHFGRSLVDLIRNYPGQEIGTHTFSHYYCLEPGQNLDSFRQDLLSAVKTGQAQGLTLKSIVFPRNQMNAGYLDACRQLGIRCYRGNERGWFYARGSTQNETIFARAARLLDSYVNLSGHNTYDISKTRHDGVVNLPSSRFLRPYNAKLAPLDLVRRQRIIRSLRHAAERGEVYHLWWHPHNFGCNLEANLTFLRGVLETFRELRSERGMESLTMSEASMRARID